MKKEQFMLYLDLLESMYGDLNPFSGNDITSVLSVFKKTI